MLPEPTNRRQAGKEARFETPHACSSRPRTREPHWKPGTPTAAESRSSRIRVGRRRTPGPCTCLTWFAKTSSGPCERYCPERRSGRLCADDRAVARPRAASTNHRSAFRQPASFVRGRRTTATVGIGLVDGDCFLLDADAILEREFRNGIDDAANWPRTDRDEYTGLLADGDERVLRPGRTVDEVPRAQSPFLAFDKKQAFARDHEEILLCVLTVIEGREPPRLDHRHVDP